MGLKKGSGDCFYQTRFLDITVELFSGICKSIETDLHLGIIAKDYDFRLKGMNI